MLRRTQTIRSGDGGRESFADDEEPVEAPVVVERRRADTLLGEVERSASLKSDRQRIEQLRAEFQRALQPGGDESSGPVMRPEGRIVGFLKRSRFILVLVALIAGGVAAYLALQRPPDASIVEPAVQTATEPAVVVKPVAKTRVLVASQAIGMGQRLTPSAMQWQDWPDDAVRPEYITATATPEAITDMSGSIARFEIFPGEPIGHQKLVQATDGYLSAVLQSGMRGVSVSVTPDSASGGFVVPNDRVDVVLTRQTANGQQSETIMRNVRVLAINARLGETGTTGAAPAADPADPSTQVFVNTAIATLELNETQSEMIIDATSAGKLSLALRSLSDAGKGSETEQAANQAIRMTSKFWLN